MNILAFGILNLLLIYVFYRISTKKNLLAVYQNGKWWLTWLAIGIITLMDELTSIYYAPAEAYRFIGIKVIFYIALTSFIIRYYSLRMIEIAEILENHNIKGGGVYSFAYFVWGPKISFLAAASILVDYILTATISTVSAVENGAFFFHIPVALKFVFMFFIIWSIAGLNILGIKENAKFTYGIFVFAAFVLLNLLLGGLLNFNDKSLEILSLSANSFSKDFNILTPITSFGLIVTGIGSCILAYSGVESVLQTASLTRSWREIRKGYLFLAFTVGIVTPLIVLFAMTSGVQITKHETDLIPAFATITNGKFFAVIVSILASITLIMATNTAMVASAELIEKVAERYKVNWLRKSNKNQSLYRIHLINATFYSIILIITAGSQQILAEMYAVGLVASFVINLASLIKYRFSEGSTKHTYNTSRIGTLIVFIFILSVFFYIIAHRPYGTLLWLIISTLVLLFGIWLSKERAPEIPIKKLSKTPLDVIFAIVELPQNDVNIYFKRPTEDDELLKNPHNIFVSFYHPRLEIPDNMQRPNLFWLSLQERMDLYDMIYGFLETIQYDLPPEKKLTIHFGWPLSSWIDRLSTGFKVYKIMKLPKQFPNYKFVIEYIPKKK
jgi:amino acid transporter